MDVIQCPVPGCNETFISDFAWVLERHGQNCHLIDDTLFDWTCGSGGCDGGSTYCFTAVQIIAHTLGHKRYRRDKTQDKEEEEEEETVTFTPASVEAEVQHPDWTLDENEEWKRFISVNNLHPFAMILIISSIIVCLTHQLELFLFLYHQSPKMKPTISIFCCLLWQIHSQRKGG